MQRRGLNEIEREARGAIGQVAIVQDWLVPDAKSPSCGWFIPSRESALVLFLRPGNYTGIVSGKVGSTGVALVEFYNAQSHVRQTAFRSARVCGVHEIIFRGSQACKPDPTDALLACWCGRLQARGPESAKMANFRYLSPPRSVEPWRRHRTFGRSPGRVRDRVGAVPLVAASLC